MKSNVVLFVLALLFPCAALACDSTGAYGVAFGGKPGREARKQPGSGKASAWYAVTPPHPDERFDRYLARVDVGTGTIYQVDAIRTILPKESAGGLTHEQREEGARQAEAFAQDYIAALAPDVRARLVDKYGTSHWEGATADGTWMDVDVDFSWEVTVSCRDLDGERVMGERVLPEMFR